MNYTLYSLILTMDALSGCFCLKSSIINKHPWMEANRKSMKQLPFFTTSRYPPKCRLLLDAYGYYVYLDIVPCKYCTVNYVYLHSHQHTGILVPAQQRVLPISSLSVFNIGPAAHKVFMAHNLSQFSSDSTIHVFNNIEVSGEEDIEIPLVNLYS